MSASLAALHGPIDVGLGGVLLANMLAVWLDGDPKVLPTGEAADESQDHRTPPQQNGLCMFVSRRWHKSATIKKARSASMPCGRKRRNWVGASRRSAFSTGIWGCRGRRQRGGTTSRHW